MRAMPLEPGARFRYSCSNVTTQAKASSSEYDY
jgi:hypothetical protein